ncbi:MAG: pyruvate kinase [Lachnospiraceae bacterium]|nr:pyruvate kinase [Lachnospiraceae bacterium]
MRKTKIIATLGPNAENIDILREMAKIMDVGRFNFSHGDYDEHKKKLTLLDQVSKELNRPIARLLDTKGPEIRTGVNKNREKISLVKGSHIILSMVECECDDKKIYVNYEKLIDDVNVDNTILLDDGLIELKVISKDKEKNTIECEIIVSGELGEHKGVNVPGLAISLPDLTDKDREDIRFGIKEGFDIIAASFVRSANCIKEIRKILDENNSHMKIIAKIENEEGIKNLDEIMNEADGIMIARGDLGVEVKNYEVPYFQKEIIKKCNEKGKIVITATQMLDSMMRNPRPTRAETTDVANAIYDGTDCVMLSGETANGKYPVEAINMMNKIAIETEKHIDYSARREHMFLHDLNKTITNTVCKMVVNSANILKAKAIVAPTSSGHTALILSKYKPNEPIYALTNNISVCRQLMLCYAVTPFYWDRPNSSDLIVGDSIVKLKNEGKVENGDICVIAFGVETMESGDRKKVHTNTMRIATVY